MKVKDFELPVDDFFLPIERAFNSLLQTKLRLLDLFFAKRKERHLLVDFLYTDALPECFFLEVLNDRISLTLLVIHKLIDVCQADGASFFFRPLDFFTLRIN